MDDLDKLVPQPATLTVARETLAIQPLQVGRLPAFLRAISPTLQQLKAPQIDWLTLFIEHGDDLLQAVSIAVDKPRAWVDALAADEAILLAVKVVEVNADFFTRTVLPRLDGLISQMVREPVTSGSTPSSA